MLDCTTYTTASRDVTPHSNGSIVTWQRGSALSHSPFRRLPTSLECYIFSFLQEKEVASICSTVCKRWNLLTKNPILHRMLENIIYQKYSTDEIARYANQFLIPPQPPNDSILSRLLCFVSRKKNSSLKSLIDKKSAFLIEKVDSVRQMKKSLSLLVSSIKGPVILCIAIHFPKQGVRLEITIHNRLSLPDMDQRELQKIRFQKKDIVVIKKRVFPPLLGNVESPHHLQYNSVLSSNKCWHMNWNNIFNILSVAYGLRLCTAQNLSIKVFTHDTVQNDTIRKKVDKLSGKLAEKGLQQLNLLHLRTMKNFNLSLFAIGVGIFVTAYFFVYTNECKIWEFGKVGALNFDL